MGSLGRASLRCNLQKWEGFFLPIGADVKMVHLVVALFLVGQAFGQPSQTQPPLRSNPFSHREGLEAAQEQEDLQVELNAEESRVRREARLEPLTGISITNNFEILRRRYIDTMERARVRANQRKRSQIEQNNSFLQNVGWNDILNKIGCLHYKEIQTDSYNIIEILAPFRNCNQSLFII